MPFEIQTEENTLLLELSGRLNIKHARDLAEQLNSRLTTELSVTVSTRHVDDVDTCILQLLVALQKSSSSFQVKEPSEAFIKAVDSCTLRRHLLARPKELQ